MNIQYTRIYIHVYIYIYIYTYVYNLYIQHTKERSTQTCISMRIPPASWKVPPMDSWNSPSRFAPESQTWLERTPKEIVPNFPHHSAWFPMISWLVSFRPPESLPLRVPREKSHGYWVGHPKNILLIVAEPSKIALSTGFCRNTGIIRDDCNP